MKYSAITIASLCSGLLLAQNTAPGNSSGRGSWSGLLVAAGCQTSNMPRTTAQAAQRTSDMPRNTADPYRNTTDVTRTTDLSNRTTETPSRTTDLARASTELSRNSTSDQAGNTAMDRTTAGRTTAGRTTAGRTTGKQSGVNQSGNSARIHPESPDAIARRTSPGADQEVTTRSDLGNSHPSHPATGSADRMATPSSEDAMVVRSLDDSCRITSSTPAFALRLDDGRMVRFDEASNAKIQQQLQSGDRLSHKSKIFRVKVNGSMQGDAIQAAEIQI